MMKSSAISICKSSLRLAWALLIWKLVKKNTDAGYQALIRLHLKTRGRTTEFLMSLIKAFHPPLNHTLGKSLLPDLSNQELADIQRDLETKGYHVLKFSLPENILKELMTHATTQPGLLRPKDTDPITADIKRAVYKPGQPEGVRYEFLPEDLMKIPATQKIFSDPQFLKIARNYLKVEPIIDIVAMWWHTDYQKTPDSNAAQFYHFDMDRVKWLKFFFYITDVNSNSGPHCFIEGTHNPKNVPQTLLDKGYVRLTDEEIASHFDSKKIIEFTGKAGTIIIEDTAGFHKGKHVHSGDRLIFQTEYVASLFGTPSIQKFKVNLKSTPELAQFKTELSRVATNLENIS